MSRRVRLRAAAASFTAVWLGLTLLCGPAAANPGPHRVSYRGYVLSVPASWPVFDLARQPQTCVRFDRHAVYLGVPSSRQRCPGHAAGRTEAILVQPLAARAASAAGSPPARGNETTFPVRGAAVVVTATWGASARRLESILGRALHPASIAGSAAAHRLATRARAASAPRASTYDGKGFDACSAPSATVMNDWGASPYRALGVYIGGVNSACAQPNLTSNWVRSEVAAGWHLIPTYVGLQAPGACGCAAISGSSAAAEGTAAANDAVNQAQRLGMPAGTPIYDDMEGYSRTSSNTGSVLAFLQAWTQQLHALGYLSGVYSSGGSGMADLASQYGTGYTEPDDIWIGDWNGQATASDPYVPSGDWAGAQRIHQYAGAHNETWGGATINIDSDFVDGATAGTASPFPDGTFIEASGDPHVYRVAGGAPLYVSDWSAFGGPQPVQSATAAQFASLLPYPASGTFLTTTTGQVYRVAGGAPFAIASWTPYGGPQPSVTIDEWNLQNVGNPLSHLIATPLNGTVVEGLPSATYWVFSAGSRSQVSATAGAVAVDDADLSAFPITPNTGGVTPPKVTPPPCVAPKLAHLTLLRAGTSLRRAHCRLGRVRRPRHWRRHHVLRVWRQSVKPGSRHAAAYRIGLQLL